MVGANPWYIVGEDYWYMVGANPWYMLAEDYWYIVARGVTLPFGDKLASILGESRPVQTERLVSYLFPGYTMYSCANTPHNNPGLTMV